MKHVNATILICFVASIVSVLVLVATSRALKKSPGSFLREFPPHPALEGNTIDLGYNSYYIAGVTRHYIYLGSYSAPLHMVVANHALTDTFHVRLKIEDMENEKFWAPRVEVDSPDFYFYDGTVPVIFHGKTTDWTAARTQSDRAYFQDLVPIKNCSFFIRSLSAKTRENTLGRLTCYEPHVSMNPGILQKQVDGIFCTDGTMNVDKTNNQLIYLYRYRNEYIVMDTNLNVLWRHHTIDTTTTAVISVSAIDSEGTSTLSSPPQFVNYTSFANENLLFVVSKILARNEHPDAHNTASVIDVYDVPTGIYRFSFYIHDYRGSEKLRMVAVSGDKLFALHYNHLQVWELRPAVFEKGI